MSRKDPAGGNKQGDHICQCVDSSWRLMSSPVELQQVRLVVPGSFKSEWVKVEAVTDKDLPRGRPCGPRNSWGCSGHWNRTEQQWQCDCELVTLSLEPADTSTRHTRWTKRVNTIIIINTLHYMSSQGNKYQSNSFTSEPALTVLSHHSTPPFQLPASSSVTR